MSLILNLSYQISKLFSDTLNLPSFNLSVVGGAEITKFLVTLDVQSYGVEVMEKCNHKDKTQSLFL